jgi:chitodextrinase
MRDHRNLSQIEKTLTAPKRFRANALIRSSDKRYKVTLASLASGIALFLAANAFAAEGPIAAYNFNAGTGTSLSDESGNERVGTLINGPTWTTGRNGGGLSFDGSDDYVTVGDVDQADGVTAVTVSAWVKFRNSGGGSVETHLVDKSQCSGYVNGGPWELGVAMTSAHKAEFLIHPRDGSPSAYIFSGPSVTSVDDGNWHYVTGRYDGSALSIWVDGVLENSRSAPGLTLSSSNYHAEFGGHCNGYSYPFNGTLDDVRIYRRPLTQAEIQGDMATPVGDTPQPSPPPQAAPVVLGYGFDAGTGATVADQSGSGNNGTLVNGATWGPGKNGGGMLFDGADDHVSVADSSSLSIAGNQLSFSAWVYPTATSGTRIIAGKPYSSTAHIAPYYSYALYLIDTNRVTFRLRLGSTTRSLNTQQTLPANAWSHVAGVYDGSTMTIYINGAPASSTSASGNITPFATPLLLGINGEKTQAWSGYLDDVRLSNRALTSSELQTHMNTPVGGASGTDTTAPTVAISAPAQSSTVSGTISVSATAADNIAVVGVRFLLDGAALGAEDTSSPYSTSWNTATASNGAHTLAAVARDAAGNSTTSTSITVTVSNDTTPPTTPTSLVASNITTSSVTISWNASTDNVGVAGYRVYRNGSQIGTTSSTSFTDSGLSSGTSYSYNVAAFDAAGNTSAQSAGLSVTTTTSTPSDTTPPTVPSGLTATNVTSSQVSFQWSPSTDNVGVAGYRVYRNGALIGTVTTTNFTDGGRSASTTYTYNVAAFDAAGNASAQSANLVVTTSAPPGDTTPPSVPTNLSTSSVSSTSISFSWSAATDNVGVSGYRVYRNGSSVGTTSATSYTDNGLTPNSTYSYTVSAFDAAGNSSAASSPLVVNTSASSTNSYSTNFDLTEFPISEGGRWRRASNQWTSVRTSGGNAYGTNGPADTYDDSYALLSGFGPNQTAEAVVYRSSSLNTAVTHEVELMLRGSDDSNNARGYEVLFAYYGGVQIVRWNGPMGNYTVLPVSGPGSIGRNFVTGDVIKASIIGSTISVYVNGQLIGQTSDSTFATGQPGISFFTRPGGNSAHFALTSYTVSSN